MAPMVEIMIPKLYTTSMSGNGVGCLSSIISGVHKEERNGISELEIVYPVNGLHYADIALGALLLAKPGPYGENQLFKIYAISKPMDGNVTILARHISYDLAGVTVEPFRTESCALALQGLKEHSANQNGFTFWTDINSTAEFKVEVPTSLVNCLGGSDGSVLDVFGGEYEFDNYTVKLHSQRGMDRGVTIRYGKNLIDLAQEENCDNVYTAVYPFYKNSEGVVTILPEKFVKVTESSSTVRVLPLDVSSEFQEEPSLDEIREKAKTYIRKNKIGEPKVSLEVDFAQLRDAGEYQNYKLLETVCLCDTVAVYYPHLGVSGKAKCVACEYDFVNEVYNSMTLGDAASNLVTTLLNQDAITQDKINQAKSDLMIAIERATALITGNRGGYVVLHSSTGGKMPDEILIMDKPDIDTATKVWRWNMAGWGYSSTGYNGPFRLAATMEGAINADFITVGTLSASLIKTGVLNGNLIQAGILQDNRGGVAFRFDVEKGIAYINGTFESTDNSGKSKLSNANGAITLYRLGGDQKIGLRMYQGTAEGCNIDLYDYKTDKRTVSIEGGNGYGYFRTLKLWTEDGGERTLYCADDGTVRWV